MYGLFNCGLYWIPSIEVSSTNFHEIWIAIFFSLLIDCHFFLDFAATVFQSESERLKSRPSERYIFLAARGIRDHHNGRTVLRIRGNCISD